jgi:capsular exopolysaccharide synthesis family protein
MFGSYTSQANGKGYLAPMSVGVEPSISNGAAKDEDYVFSLGEILRVIRMRLLIILLIAAVSVGAVVGSSLAQTPIYEASIKILVGQERGITQTPNDVIGLQQLTQTMTAAVSSRPVAEAVIRQQNLQITTETFLAENLSVEQLPNTQFIQVYYRDSSPEKAQRVANAIGEVFSERVSEVSPSANAITATVWEPAVVPDEPVSPDPVRNGLLALALGLMLGVALAFLLEYFDDSWRSPEEVEQISRVPTYGIIPSIDLNKAKKDPPRITRSPEEGEGSPRASKGKAATESRTLLSDEELAARLVTVAEPTSVASEAYRTLRTNLLYSLMDTPPKVLVLTSPGPGEGKSTTCANLGVVLSQAGKEVLVIDCDFRKPVMHKFFGMRNLQGVVDVLRGERRVEDVWGEPVQGLRVIPVGSIPPNPTEILGTKRFADLLAELRQRFDYVLVDAPPVGVVSDPIILATQADGMLFVLDAQNTRKASVRQAMRSLEGVGAKVLGTVMNNVKASQSGYYYGYTHYGHE